MVSQDRKIKLDKLSKSLNINCNNYERLDLALTHSSYTFENKLSPLENNERLEFFGDAVLKLITSDYLFERFPNYTEGDLTKIRAILVSDKTLAKFAQKINLGNYLKLGFHEEKMGGRKRSSTLACAFEALLGAIYQESNVLQLKHMLIKLIEDEVTKIDECEAKSNYKAILQEYTQANWNELPEYNVTKEEGPAHNKTFWVEVIINGELTGKGSGKSKKIAQQQAAKLAVENLNLIERKERTDA